MKLDKEEIDWGKLRLIVAKIKLVFGVTEEGIIKWNDNMVRNYVSELSKVVSTVSPRVKNCMNDMKRVAAPESSKENRGDNNKGFNASTSVNPNRLPEAANSSTKISPTLSESNPLPPLTKSDSAKRKRELPAWMTRAAPSDNKRMKSNSLFK